MGNSPAAPVLEVPFIMPASIDRNISRRTFLATAATFAALSTVGLSGCGEDDAEQTAAEGDVEPAAVRIGTMPTEDLLPLWVAEEAGYFGELGLDAEITSFDSAQNLSAAITAGEVDLAMTDPLRAAKLFESGTDVVMEWITLGTTPAQGRFGVLAAPDSGITSLSDLLKSETGVGLAANTVPEYVFCKLCEEEGIDSDDIVTTEVASLPERYSLVEAKSIDAAALPNSLLVLGEVNGLDVIADDTTGENLSQSVMVSRAAYSSTEEGAAAIDLVRQAWDLAAQGINADPESFRSILVEKAGLNSAVADTYPISEYPTADAYPPADLIEPQLDWMLDKGYLDAALTYDDGVFSKPSGD